MRGKFRDLLLHEMDQNESIILILGDLGYSLFDDTRLKHRRRVINVGSAEQLLIGVGVGLALEGKIPVCYSITPFLLYRPFEFIRNYLHNEQIPVKLVGSGRDDDYKLSGSTHHAFEDISIMSVLSNIELFRPQNTDDIDIKTFLYSNKPAYMNLKK